MTATFGEKLRYWRRKRGYKQWHLAQLVGILPQQISRIECGRVRRPLEKNADKIVVTLGLDYVEFWRGSGGT